MMLSGLVWFCWVWTVKAAASDSCLSPLQVGQHADGRGRPLRPPRRGHHPQRLPHPVKPPGQQRREAERREEPGRDAVMGREPTPTSWRLLQYKSSHHVFYSFPSFLWVKLNKALLLFWNQEFLKPSSELDDVTPDPVGVFCTNNQFFRVISVNMSRCKTVAVILETVIVSFIHFFGSERRKLWGVFTYQKRRWQTRLDPVLLHVLEWLSSSQKGPNIQSDQNQKVWM